MANKYYATDIAPTKLSGGEGGRHAAQGKAAPRSMPEKTANWSGPPGKTGPDRSGGVKKAKAYAKAAGI